MCGIAGCIVHSELKESSINECLGLMARRGPDSSTCRKFERPGGGLVYLLHSRLSIIDLQDRANQPFDHAAKTLAYNGELYNYIELRKELESSGRAFRTESDTEVLIQTLDERGLAGLDKCEGMWAFAMYDRANGSLSLSRDRFGEKPLYIYRRGRDFYFGSEIKFIAALLGERLPINYDHLFRYIVNGYRALYKGTWQFFEGLEELPVASWLRIDAGGAEKLEKYWKPFFSPDESMTYEAAVEGTRHRIMESMKLRLRADVPLAFCMSGGVDSVSLISIAKKVFNYDVHGFTILNDDARYEEKDMVDIAVAELGIKHTGIPISTDSFLPRLESLIVYHDSPIHTISYYAHWLLMEAIASRGYRVSVSGTAADELFTGYYDHHNMYLYEVRDMPDVYADALKNWNDHLKPIVRNPFLQDPLCFIKDPGLRDHIYLKSEQFSDMLFSGWSEPFSETNYCGSLLRNRMLNELFHECVPQILHEDDLNAMYFSIENRSPFLDRYIFEFCATIPSKHLVKNGRAKAVLRDAMRGIAPEQVVTNRRKVGFNAPIFSFLDINNPDVVARLLDDGPIFEHVRKEPIEKLLRRPDMPNSESKFLFNFINSKIFLEVFA